MTITFRVMHNGSVVSEHTFAEAEVYEPFLEESAHTLARMMGGIVSVFGETWDDELNDWRKWWEFSYIRTEDYYLWRFSTTSMREVEWDEFDLIGYSYDDPMGVCLPPEVFQPTRPIRRANERAIGKALIREALASLD